MVWHDRMGGVRGVVWSNGRSQCDVWLSGRGQHKFFFTTAVGHLELNIRISVQRPKNSRRSSGLQSRDSSVSFVFI